MGDVVLSAQHRQISIFPITFKFQKQPKLGVTIKDPSREQINRQAAKSHCDKS